MAATVSTFERASEVTYGISGDQDNREIVWIAKMSEPVASEQSDEADAAIMNYVQANVTGTWDGLTLSGVRISQLLPDKFRVTTIYTRRDLRPIGGALGVSARFSYEFATENVKTLLPYSQQRFPSTAPNHKFINVSTKDGKAEPLGADVPRPKQSFEYSIAVPAAGFTDAYHGVIESRIGKLNNATFLGRYNIGEVLFEGARGTKNTDGQSELALRFSVRRNPALPLTISGITIPNTATVYGWDIIWPLYDADVDGDDLIADAKALYVSRVFETADFGPLITP